MKNRRLTLQTIYLPTLLSLAVAALGITVLAGWLFHVAILVEINTGFVAMVFNTALCFMLTGTALAMPGLIGKPTPKLQMLIGTFIFILCTIILLEHIFDRNLGVDWAFLHGWLGDGNTRPGRLAPNTAIGFMLIGALLVLKQQVNTKRRALVVQMLTVGILMTGITGLIGYTLTPDLLFGWARSARMAIPTALGMIVVALVFWLGWYRADWYRSRSYFQEDEKISFIAGAILVVVTITAGMTGFVYQQRILENTLKENLHAILKSRVILFHTVISQAETNSENASKELVLQNQQSGTSQSLVYKRYGLILNHLLDNGFHAVALYDLAGKQLASAGMLAHNPEMTADLHAPVPAMLLWNHGLYLQIIVPVVEQGVVVARLLTEQPLYALRQQLFDLDGLGNSDEIALCKEKDNMLICFPEGTHSTVYSSKRQSAPGQLLPMSYAVEGQAGIIASVDYRKHNVVAAYTPLAPGLGLVVKEDTEELYGVIRDQLKAVIPVLLFLIALSTFFLRSQLKPLAARLMLSERLALEKEMEIQAVVGNVGEGIITIDETGMIVSFNAAASKIFGYQAEEVFGKSITFLMPPNMRDLHQQGMSHYLQSGEAHVIGKQGVELPGLRKDGVIFLLELTINEIKLDQRRLFVGILRDITERKQLEEKLVFLAQYDALTGLPNRTLFMERLSSAILRAQRSQTGIGVLFLDLDGFKQINDTLGHQSGDDLLKQFAARLLKLVRKTDTVARLGGDEFTIVLEGLKAPQKATEVVAEKIIAAIQAPFWLAGKTVVVTTSIGVAVHTDGEVNVDELLSRADHAMYKAKKGGKNHWCMAIPDDGD